MAGNGVMQLSTFGELKKPSGSIAFMGMIRVLDEGVNEVRVEIPDHPPMYGEWRPRFEKNGNDLNVEIVSFGYTNPSNVGNMRSNARRHLNKKEVTAVRDLIESIFRDKSIRKEIFPFSIKKANFLGGVRFLGGWVCQRKRFDLEQIISSVMKMTG